MFDLLLGQFHVGREETVCWVTTTGSLCRLSFDPVYADRCINYTDQLHILPICLPFLPTSNDREEEEECATGFNCSFSCLLNRFTLPIPKNLLVALMASDKCDLRSSLGLLFKCSHIDNAI